jgi:ribosome assembly protein 1
VTVIEHLPSPKQAQETRLAQLIDASPGAGSIDPTVRDSMISLKKDRKDPVVAFVSKMVSIPEKELPENRTKTGTSMSAEEARDMARKKRAEIARAQAATNGESPDIAELRTALQTSTIGEDTTQVPAEDDKPLEEPERLIGFARLFSGTLEVGDEIYVLHPKFTPANPHASPEPQKVTVTALYLLMGRGLEPLTSVPAGVVFGIGGLEGHIMKSGTLCSQLEGGVNLAGLTMGAQPIVRVALEPENPADLSKMVTGLKLLQQSDPCASYEIMPNGEHVILTAGELHLERCLKDLRERFAHCEIQVGAPIVPYRESIVSAAEMNPPKEKDMPRGATVGVVASKQLSVRLRVRPLPTEVTEYLIKSAAAIQGLYADHGVDVQHDNTEDADEDDAEEVDVNDTGPRAEDAQKSLKSLQDGLREAFTEALKENKAEREVWKGVIDRIVAFGPRRNGPNLLVDATQGCVFQHM